MSEMRKRIEQVLTNMIFRHQIIQSKNSLEIAQAEALLALKQILVEEIPSKATPLSKTRPLSKRNVGWNEAIDSILSKLESLEGPSWTANKNKTEDE